MTMPATARSMTGFGRCHIHDELGEQTWEVRTVNARFLEIKWRMPNYCRRLENAWDKIVRTYLTRGRVEIILDVRLAAPDAVCPSLDTTQAKGMLDQMRNFARAMDMVFQPEVNQMLLVPGLWREPSGELPENLVLSLSNGLRSVLEDVQQARIREGVALSRDILSRLKHMAAIVAKVRSQCAELVPKRMEGLQERIDALLQTYNTSREAPQILLEDSRLLQELALLADRLDVSEELTRLAAHLEEAERILARTPDPGRRLDFLFQECLREITTCGNKTQDAAISRYVVAFKAELEKCREQVQNLE
jgi:uncharacterized protein (TIGR00255 family)